MCHQIDPVDIRFNEFVDFVPLVFGFIVSDCTESANQSLRMKLLCFFDDEPLAGDDRDVWIILEDLFC